MLIWSTHSQINPVRQHVCFWGWLVAVCCMLKSDGWPHELDGQTQVSVESGGNEVEGLLV
jgi:hypothetical protein